MEREWIYSYRYGHALNEYSEIGPLPLRIAFVFLLDDLNSTNDIMWAKIKLHGKKKHFKKYIPSKQI